MSGEIISDLENAILSPLHSRQKFDPDYFNKERKFIEKYHRDFERLFIYIDSMSTFSEESDKDLITFLSEDLYSSLFHTMRSKKADCIIENFIKKYSDLTRTIIVNLGAGLDTTFYRLSNTNLLNYYNLDIPEGVEFRRKYFGEEPGIHTIEKSVFDESWFDCINYKKGDNILFVALGLFCYFKSDDVISLIKNMSKKFPNGELFFSISHKKSEIMNNGNLDKKIRFNFERLKQLLEENSNLKILYNSPFYAELVQENTRIEEYLEKTKKDVGTDDIDTNLIRKNAMRMLFDNPVQLVHLKFKKNILSLILEKFF